MALISIIEGFRPRNDERLLGIAEGLRPELLHGTVQPVAAFTLKDRYSPEARELSVEQATRLPLEKGSNLCLDFGTHCVGYLTLRLDFRGSHPDAPAFIKLKLAETLRELHTCTDDYDGWVASGWLQEEYIHVDELPTVVTLPRRYALRYLKLTVLDTSPKYRLVVSGAELRTESSADRTSVPPYVCSDPELAAIDRVGVATLAECMQDVFEDGPKRDRRLWMGDLRLQALTSYVSCRNDALVRRCLYLFAGSRFPDGRVAACLFTRPTVEADDTYLADYALFFVCALEEYLSARDAVGTPDTDTLDDLYEIAMEQVEHVLDGTEAHTVTAEQARGFFVDWNDALDRQACAHAIVIYALGYALRLAARRGDRARIDRLTAETEMMRVRALEGFRDAESGLFVSNGQCSIASQVWMVLAGVLPREEAAELLTRAEPILEHVKMTTPYMHSYYVMALIAAGLYEKAEAHIRYYWGSMVSAGADTYWEAWDPKDPDASPYGSFVINSYCHAWSCTPTYILRRLLPTTEN